VSEDGAIVEALARGVTRRHLDCYTSRDYQIVRIQGSRQDREQVVAFAEWAARECSRYGFLTIASIALCVITGCRVTFFVDGELICSGLVARALERTTAVFDVDPVHMTPADLARYYQVPAPPSGVLPRQRLRAGAAH